VVKRQHHKRTGPAIFVAALVFAGPLFAIDGVKEQINKRVGEGIDKGIDKGIAVDSVQLLATSCTGCHAGRGNAIPPLKGRRAKSLANQLLRFRAAGLDSEAKQRNSETLMPRIAAGYTEPQLLALAEYFAEQRR